MPLKLTGISAKQGAAAAVALGLMALVGTLVKFILDDVAEDIEFLIRLVDTTCGK